MLETSARLLRLLSLLQTRPGWTGAELADRLAVSPRTVRYDIDKLRNLGYPVHAVPGVAGGYRLGSGAELPPLLLDDDEAVAVAVGLRTAAGGTVDGIEEASLRALAKLEQVLPARLRHRVRALHGHTVSLSPGGPSVSADTLTLIAAACRDHTRLRFDYRTHDGTAAARDAEPYRLVHTGRRWYLVAWDVDRAGWRTFRVDRITPRVPQGPRFTPRESPPDDVVPRGVDTALAQHRATATVHAPAAVIAGRLPASVLVEPVDDDTCLVHAGGDTPMRLALHLLMLDADFDVDGPPELLDALRTLAARAGGYRPQPGVTASHQGGKS
ncbi:helix-turn-helix transcriptional regulator [Nonomuraea sp. LPB2021202275-12-8]|uniref:helix-turn-helix transcriptional regulator n=1 Tax=Nonomuraea sp. LPB2021202275-12-8 TaxID=3120159 RepID=UPI00300D651D